MAQKLKNSITDSYVIDGIKFRKYFIAHRFDNTHTATNYVFGTFKVHKGEANMEKMEEEIPESEYRAYQQFISNSNWDCAGLQKEVACECSEVLSELKQKYKTGIGFRYDKTRYRKRC